MTTAVAQTEVRANEAQSASYSESMLSIAPATIASTLVFAFIFDDLF